LHFTDAKNIPTFIVVFASCNQTFTCGPSYERHLKKHFKNSENCVKEIKQKQIQQDYANEKPKLPSASYELNICHESKQSVPITSKSEVRSFKTQDVFKKIKQFTLNLHNKNNFPRKDVYAIQNQIKEYMLTTLFALLDDISKDFCEKDLIEVQKFISDFKNLFDGVDTEYKLLKNLEQYSLILYVIFELKNKKPKLKHVFFII